MAMVVALMSISLDGYVADANDGVAEVFDWCFSGDVEGPMELKPGDTAPRSRFRTRAGRSLRDDLRAQARPLDAAAP